MKHLVFLLVTFALYGCKPNPDIPKPLTGGVVITPSLSGVTFFDSLDQYSLVTYGFMVEVTKPDLTIETYFDNAETAVIRRDNNNLPSYMYRLINQIDTLRIPLQVGQPINWDSLYLGPVFTDSCVVNPYTLDTVQGCIEMRYWVYNTILDFSSVYDTVRYSRKKVIKWRKEIIAPPTMTNCN